MTGPGDRFSERPMREWLAAYADGELDTAARARVEAWLADNPDARAELDAQRRYSGKNGRLWRAAAGPNPSEGSWSRVVTRVQDAILNPPRTAETPERSRRWTYVAVTAFALLLAFVLWPTPNGQRDNDPISTEPAFALAADEDIEIVSLPESDADMLIVGRSPLTGAIVLASSADITLVTVFKDTDGMMPMMFMQVGPDAPMIVAPMPAAR